ncbi:MAG: AtpZ/AtpI family protein, partial [bacterium]
GIERRCLHSPWSRRRRGPLLGDSLSGPIVDYNDALKTGLQFTHLGMTMVVIVGVFGAGGYYLDGYFSTGNVLTVTGFIFGAFMGLGYFILEIYRLATEGLGSGDEDNDSTND